LERAEAAYRRMFEGKESEELVTLTEREGMAMLIGKELAAFMMEEHVAMDAAEGSTACCPKCGQAGTPAPREGKKVEERTMTTLAGDIRMQRQRWKCAKCRIIFFSARRSPRSGHGGFQSVGAGEGGSPSEQGVVVRRGE
jgi:hypothetical protein